MFTLTLRNRMTARLMILAMSALLSFAVLMPGLANAQSQDKKATLQASAKVTLVKVTLVKSDHVCMVNNELYPDEQLPFELEGHTYHVCCDMCGAKLTGDKSIQQAIDPVTGKPINKATAVIGAKPDKSILYFESEETLKKYNAGVGQ